MRTMGILSFGMYLWHPMAGRWARGLFEEVGGRGPYQDGLVVVQWTLYLLLTLGLAALTYGLVESPFLRLKGNLRGTHSPRRAPQLHATAWLSIAVVAGIVAFATSWAVQRWLRAASPAPSRAFHSVQPLDDRGGEPHYCPHPLMLASGIGPDTRLRCGAL